MNYGGPDKCLDGVKKVDRARFELAASTMPR